MEEEGLVAEPSLPSTTTTATTATAPSATNSGTGGGARWPRLDMSAARTPAAATTSRAGAAGDSTAKTSKPALGGGGPSSGSGGARDRDRRGDGPGRGAEKPPPLQALAPESRPQGAGMPGTTAPWRVARDAGGSDSGPGWDVAPDGGSAGREGRQFAVASVGHNGRIYLRPTIRSAHQRYPQPHFIFPMTPPPDGLDAATQEQLLSPRGRAGADFDSSSPWSVANSPTTTAPDDLGPLNRSTAPWHHRSRPSGSAPRRPRRRAVSDTTIREPDGGLKIIITRPGNGMDDEGAEDEEEGKLGLPTLDINIPSWRLGSPRFSEHGTPMIRGASSYAPTEAMSVVAEPRGEGGAAGAGSRAGGDVTGAHMSLPALPTQPLASQHHHQHHLAPPPIPPSFAGPASWRLPPPRRLLVIGPDMFDALTLRPQCDDGAVVRYSAATGAITAATPARLVAEITSPSLVDYELLSDFFLTYRTFLEAGDLLQMLMARWRWALRRGDGNDDTKLGAVCRVRTFVAIRHWIVNYFTEDFATDHELRVSFCDLLNHHVAHELSSEERTRKVQVQILTELKKCWRRVCAQFWDGPEFDDGLGVFEPLAPGAVHAPEAAAAADNGPPQLDELLFPSRPSGPGGLRQETSFYADVARAGHLASSVVVENRPSTPPTDATGTSDADAAALAMEELRRQACSPTSMFSVEAMSCSFTAKPGAMPMPPFPHYRNPLSSHPVATGSVSTTAAAVAAATGVATTPRSLVGKRVRPSQSTTATTAAHRRTGSLTDSLRDRVTTMTNGATITYPFADSDRHYPAMPSWAPPVPPLGGSLVRGNLIPPGQAFVEVGAAPAQRQTTLVVAPPQGQRERFSTSAMSGPGMRKLLRSVRRALKSPGTTTSGQSSTLIGMPSGSPTGGRFPGMAATLPAAAGGGARSHYYRQHHQRQYRRAAPPPPVRIDLLGADVAEAFKKAVREDQAAEAEQEHEAREPAVPKVGGDGSATRTYSLLNVDLTGPSFDQLAGDGGVISATMSGALPAVNASIEAFANSLMPTAGVGAGPTPPTTPPDGDPVSDTPRRSSCLLNQHVIGIAHPHPPPYPPPAPPPPEEATPQTMPDRSGDDSRPSFESYRTESPAPSFGHSFSPSDASARRDRFGIMRRRRRQEQQQPSLSSIVRRRCASYQASSFSCRSTDDRASIASVLSVLEEPPPQEQEQEQPARVLRRRPGGDLRAAQNVGDLAPLPLRRSQSTGSLATITTITTTTGYSGSLRGESLLFPLPRGARRTSTPTPMVEERSASTDDGGHDDSQRRSSPFSIGAMAEPSSRRNQAQEIQNDGHISLLSTYSSRGVMRPSFEIEAQRLAQIPDDDDDDGGVESALLKLEGRYDNQRQNKNRLSLSMEPRRRRPPAPAPSPPPATLFSSRSSSPPSPERDAQWPDPEVERREKREHRQLRVAKDVILAANVASSSSGSYSSYSPDSSSSSSSHENTTSPPDHRPRHHHLSDHDHDHDIHSNHSHDHPSDHDHHNNDTNDIMHDNNDDTTTYPLEHDDSQVRSFLSETTSGESYSSIPLVDRGLDENARVRTGERQEAPSAHQKWADTSVLRSPDEESPSVISDATGWHHRQSFHFDFAPSPLSGAGGGPLPLDERAATDRQATQPDDYAQQEQPDQSEQQKGSLGEHAAEDEDEDDVAVRLDQGDEGDEATNDDSELSSEMSAELAEPDDVADNSGAGFPIILPRTSSLLPPPSHIAAVAASLANNSRPGPLGGLARRQSGADLALLPPTTLTLTQALAMTPMSPMSPMWRSLPSTPLTSSAPPLPPPLIRHSGPAGSDFEQQQRQLQQQQLQQQQHQLYLDSRYAAHLPFILAFDSDTLAQQFTLIEKDAINEITWTDLVDMAWRRGRGQMNSSSRNNNGASWSWVDFLRGTTDARGFEVAIGRFNLMVKWVASEIVLTQDVEERARCVVKLIHVAQHCRRYRNFATLAQIATALASREVAGLERTWDLVPAADAAALRDMSRLTSPGRDFYALRAEMEAGPGADAAGCIPFVAVYTHDLLATAQRPSEVAGSPHGPPLVNFERCRAAAATIKTLLRLLEASTLYDFEPVEGVTERCLWVGALSDKEIQAHAARVA